MKVKSKIDLWISIVLWSQIILFSVIMFFVPADEAWIFFLMIFPFLLLMVWILVGSYYELREDLIYMKIGPFFGKIKYDNIKSLKLTKNLLSSMALSAYRIEIKEHNKGYMRGTTMISPINREEFLEDLKRRCYNLEKWADKRLIFSY